MKPTTYRGALHGVRILDLAGNIASGYCGKLFADHGADVLLVEPPAGFQTRRLPPFATGVAAPEGSGMHAYLSTNKRSVVCTEHGQLLELARGASLVMDGAVGNCRPLRLEELAEVSCNAILLSITWFGQDGVYSGCAGSDGVCQALTGQIDRLGKQGGEPMIPGGYHAQMIAGVTAFVGAIGQVLARDLGNVSGADHLDVSVHEANFCLTEIDAMRAHLGMEPRTRIGVNRFFTTYPLGIYPCRDGWLGVTVLTPSQWDSFCRLLGLDELANVEQYKEGLGRLRDADKLDRIISEQVRDKSATDLATRGQGMRIPVTIVPTMEQLFCVDQYVARGAFAPVVHPDLGPIQLPVTPFRLHSSPARAGGPVSRLGADTDAILSDVVARQ